MKKILSLFLLVISINASATHIIGGDMTSRCLGGLTQEVTVILYKDIQSPLIPNNIIIDYSNTSYTWNRNRTVVFSNYFLINSYTEAYIFVDTLTLPAYDSYIFTYFSCCRYFALANVNNGVMSDFYLDTRVVVDSTCNSTPAFLVPSYGTAMVNVPYTINLNAYDVNGDSLSYELITPLISYNFGMQGYIFPNATISNTGLLTMTFNTIGFYDICVKVSEYRNGVRIGYVLREMLIDSQPFNSIEEIELNNSNDNLYYDILGRKINLNYNGIKINKKL